MVYVRGGWQGDVSKNGARRQMDFADAFAEVVGL